MKRVLVVYKKSFLQLHKSLARATAEYPRIRKADEENRCTKDMVTRELKRRRISYDVALRSDSILKDEIYRKYDLVIAIGGDGTFFAAARYLKNTPILSVNSDTQNSLALFSSTNRNNFARRLDEIKKGVCPHFRIWRMAVYINGERLMENVLNDVLFISMNPARLVRYIFKTGNHKEEQRSSGVWISTAAGSTASVKSAGGNVLPIFSTKLEYVVREPYNWNLPKFKFVKGVVSEAKIKTLSDNTVIWLDGGRLKYDLRFGDEVVFKSGVTPLLVYGFDLQKRRIFEK